MARSGHILFDCDSYAFITQFGICQLVLVEHGNRDDYRFVDRDFLGHR